MLEEEVYELNKWIFELDNERKAAEAATKIATTKFYRAKEELYGRLQKLRKETQSRRAKEDELTKASKALCRSEKELEIKKILLETPQETQRRMKKEWDNIDADGHRTLKGGSRRWPTGVVLMICELLINGTWPSGVPSCIHTVYETLYKEEPDELPSINFVRECRVFVEVMGETLTAIKLANVPEWSQLWTDATTRRQITFTTLIIGVLAESGDIDPVVISSCIFMEDETSEMQVDGIVKEVTQSHYLFFPWTCCS
jgi:hypothetical protein